ncbi:hypothetical protein DPMN_031983 [Dreissena polymorpha]|uniref:Uncharacterized protein n=1 Tax=Dreissena polymorpha TaxID=45954 RepID=A0A9D4RHT8_DREPO|nr:hypothetical protein DPMN_031983 [Dreissena polymorpha]
MRKVAIGESNMVPKYHSGEETLSLPVDKCDKISVSDVFVFPLSVNTVQKMMHGGHMKTGRHSLLVDLHCNKSVPFEDNHKDMMYPISFTDEEEERISLENNAENNETRCSFGTDYSVNTLANCSESIADMHGADSIICGSVSKYSCATTHVVMNVNTCTNLYVHIDDKCGRSCRTACPDNCDIANNTLDHQAGSSSEIDDVDSGSVYHVNDCIGGSDFEGSVKANETVVSETTKHKLELNKKDKNCYTQNTYFEIFSAKDAIIQTDSYCKTEKNISSHSKSWLTYTKTKEGTFVRITSAREKMNVTEVKQNDDTNQHADKEPEVGETSKQEIEADHVLDNDSHFEKCMLLSEKAWVNNDADYSEFAYQPNQTNYVSGRIAGRTLAPDNEIDDERRRPIGDKSSEHVLDIISVKDCSSAPCVTICKFHEGINLTIVQSFDAECNPYNNILKKIDLSLIDLKFHLIFKEDEITYVANTRETSCLSLVDIAKDSCVPLLEICVMMAGSDKRTSGDRYDTPSNFGIVYLPQDTSCVYKNMVERGTFLNSTNFHMFNIAEGANKGSVSQRYSDVKPIQRFSDIGLQMCESLDEIDNETHLPITYYDAEPKTHAYGSIIVNSVNLVCNSTYNSISLICTVCKTCFLDGDTHVRDRFLPADETTENIYERRDNSAWDTWEKMSPHVTEVFKNDTDTSLFEIQIGIPQSINTDAHSMITNTSGQIDLSDTKITPSLIERIDVPLDSMSDIEKIPAEHIANASFNIFLYVIDIEKWNYRPAINNENRTCKATINLYPEMNNTSTCIQFKLLIQSMKPKPECETEKERIRYLNIPKAQWRIDSTCALVISDSDGCNFTIVINKKETSVTTINFRIDVIETIVGIPKKTGESLKELAEETIVSNCVNDEATTYMPDTTKGTGTHFVVYRYDTTDTLFNRVDITYVFVVDTNLLLLLLDQVDISKNATKHLVDSEERKCANLVGMFVPIVKHKGDMNGCLVKFSQKISLSMNAFEDVTFDCQIHVGAKISDHSKYSIEDTCSADFTIHTDDVVRIADERHVSIIIRSISQIERAIMFHKMLPREKYLYIVPKDIIVFCVDSSEKPKKLVLETIERNCVPLGKSGYNHCVTHVRTDYDAKVNIYDPVKKVYLSKIYVVDMVCSTVCVFSEKTSECQNEKRSQHSKLMMGDRFENMCVDYGICLNARYSRKRKSSRLIKSSPLTTSIGIIANETIWHVDLSHIDDIFNEYDFGASVDYIFCKSARAHIIAQNSEDVVEIHTETDEHATKVGQESSVFIKPICKETMRRLLQIIWERSVCVVGNSTVNNNIKGAIADRLTISTNSTCVSLLSSSNKHSVTMVQYVKDTLVIFVDFENGICFYLVKAGSKMRRHITRYKPNLNPKYGSKEVVCASMTDVVEELSDGDLHETKSNVKTRIQLENTAMALWSLEEKVCMLLEVSDCDSICENGIYKSDRIFLPSNSTYSEMVSVRANERDAYLSTPVFGSVANIIAEPEMIVDDSCSSDEIIDESVCHIGKECCFHVANNYLVNNICLAEKRYKLKNTGYYMLSDGLDEEAWVHLINDVAESGGQEDKGDTRRCDCFTDTTNLSVVIIDSSNEFRKNTTQGHVMKTKATAGHKYFQEKEINTSAITDVIDSGGLLAYSDINNGGYNIPESTYLAVLKTDIKACYLRNTETNSLVINNSAEICRPVVDSDSNIFTRVTDVREHTLSPERGNASSICLNMIDVKEESYLHSSRAAALDVLSNEQAQANAPFDFSLTQAKEVITDSVNEINALYESLISLDSYDVSLDSNDAIECGVYDINSHLNEHTFAQKVNVFPRSVTKDVDVEETYVKVYTTNQEGSRLIHYNTPKCAFQIPTDQTEIHVNAVPFTELYREQGRNSEFSLDNNNVADASAASQPLSSDVSHDGPILSMGLRSDNNSEHDFPVISLSTNITVDLHPDRDIHPIVDLHPNHDMRPIGLDRGDAFNPPIISLASQFTVDLSRTRGTRLVVATSEFLPRPNLIFLWDYR